MPKLSDRQREALTIIKDGGSIRFYISPGADKGGWFFEAEGHDEDLDGRVALSLDKRGFIKYAGADCYQITQTGRDALQQS